MIIAFSGHRNKLAKISDLENIFIQHPEATWIHGGAIGFDSQVESFAVEHGIKTEIIKPDYKTYYKKQAPLERNKIIVNECDLLVCLFDGRKSGGTYFTLNFARKVGKNISIINC